MNPIIIGIVVVMAVIFLFPGVGSSIATLLTGETGYCMNVPYDPNCVCPEGYSKIQGEYTRVNIGGVDLGEYYNENMYACLPKDLVLDPMAQDWDKQVVGFANQLFMEGCSGCTIDCPGQLEIMIVDDDATGAVRKLAIAECRMFNDPEDSSAGGWFAWRANFYIDNGEFHPFYDTVCKSPTGYCYLGGNQV